MPDQDETTQDETESTSAGMQKTENMIPQSRFNEVLERAKAAEQALEKSAKDAEKRRETELKEKEDYKRLYEEAQAKLEAYEQQGLDKELQRYRESFETTLAARLERIPETSKHLVPDYDDPIKLAAWLDKAEASLIEPPKPTPPNLNGGAGGAGIGNRNMPSAGLERDLEIAQRLTGLSLNKERAAQFARNPNQQTDINQMKRDET